MRCLSIWEYCAIFGNGATFGLGEEEHGHVNLGAVGMRTSTLILYSSLQGPINPPDDAFIVVSLASLLFFAGFAAAGIYAPGCSASYKWSFNSLGQNPCAVAAYLISTCHGGSFTIDALPSGFQYTGPTSIQRNDLCECNTVAYSLLSACDACQGEEWVTYSKYVANCTTVLAPGVFPNPVPVGTRVPYWTLIDVTVADTWDAVKAAAVGDTPEAGPGSKIA